jgi:putative ABC transport system permease protein
MHFDLRYAVRQLSKSPWFSLVAIVGLGLGIGANVALFSVINSIFLKPLPYREPGRLVTLTSTHQERNLTRAGFSYPRYLEVQQRQQVFSDFAPRKTGPAASTSCSSARSSGRSGSVAVRTPWDRR